MKQKTYRIKKPPKPQVSEFVLTVSNICGYDKIHNCIKLKDGYSAVIQIPGIDIFGYKRNDQEYVFSAFGESTQICACPHKFVILSDQSDFTEQIEYLTMKAEKALHPFRKRLIERQIEWLKYYETTQTDRLAYVFFFAGTPEDAAAAADRYVQTMRAGRNYTIRCDQSQCEHILKILLQGDDGLC